MSVKVEKIIEEDYKKIFVNRETFKRAVLENFEKFNKEEIDIKLIVFYGFGGIGKTELLEHLKDILKDKKELAEFEIIDINFDVYKQSNDVIDFLSFIKNRIGVKNFCFDYAVLKIKDYQGIKIEKSKFTDNILVNSILNVIEGQFVIPSDVIKIAIDKLSDKFYEQKNKQCINEIENLSIEKLKTRLPIYLAKAVNEFLKKSNKKLVFFIDNYEVVLNNEELNKVFENFVGYLDKGLFIKSSREKINWEKYDEVWSNNKYLEQQLIEPLSPKDADILLRNYNIQEDSIRKSIIESSNGIPLYIDLCIDIYFRKKKDNKEIKVEDFKKKQKEIISDFLKHLPKNFVEAIEIFSLFSFFDIQIFKYFSKNLITTFNDFISLSCIVEIDKDNKIYKINDAVKSLILESLDNNIKLQISKELLKFLENNKNIFNDYKILFTLFYDTLKIISQQKENVAEEDIENVISIGMYLIDIGFWKEIMSIIDNTVSNLEENHTTFDNALKFLKAVCLRRVNNLKESYRIYNSLNMNELGRFKNLAIFHKTNVIRILGYYSKALENYKLLCKLSKNEIDLNVKICRQYADLLFLKGKFKTSLASLKQYENFSNKLERAEIYRIIGHVYKFNFMFKKSIEYYNKAYEIANKNHFFGLKAKLYTNFTEVYSFLDFKKATEFLHKSEKENKSLNAKLELGKTYSFYSISVAKFTKNFELALKYCNKSIEIQHKVGYKSGILFGLYAKFIIFSLQNNKEESIKLYNKMKSLVKDLGVYKYLLLPCYIFFDKDYIWFQKNLEWLNFENVLNYYLKNIYS